MFQSIRRFFLRRRIQNNRIKYKRRAPSLRTYHKKKLTPARIIVNTVLAIGWTYSIIKHPGNLLVGAISMSLISNFFRRNLHLRSGLAADIIHPIIDIAGFFIATSSWLFAREFVILATVLAIPGVTRDISNRYDSY
jgi:hypothetical protein